MTDTTDTTKDPIDTILDGPQRAAWGIGNMLVVANNQAYALQNLGPLCALLSVAVDEERADQDQLQSAFGFIGEAVTAMAGDIHDTLYRVQEEAKRHFAESHAIAWRKNDIGR